MLNNVTLKDIPEKPGVYLFKNRSGKILYIGKAKNLNKRVYSYFSKSNNKTYKLSLIVKNMHTIDHIITATEKEALILEGNLIKKYRPRYNVILKDDANYPLLKLDINTPYPRLTIVRRMKNDGALYFGPYTSASAVRSTLRLIGPIFPLRKCSTNAIPKRSRPCLNYQLGRCLAPCCLPVAIEDYQEIVDQVKLFLQGRSKELISQLRETMRKASKDINFEKAARIRDQIRAVEKTVEHQSVVSSRMKDQDIIGLSFHGDETGITILLVRSGYMIGNRNYIIHYERENPGEILEALLKQYYRAREFIPPDIILSHTIDDKLLISEWLTGKAGKKVSISVPFKGNKKKLVNMAVANANTILVQRKNKYNTAIVDQAKSVLNLKRRPEHIEGIDISNLKGNFAVASLVTFVEGSPEKSGYRNYRIQHVTGIDDYSMIAEAVERRLKKGKTPDLVLIDGGKGHLSVALKTIDASSLVHPPEVISIAKADKGKAGSVDKIYLPNRKNPLILNRNHPVLSLIMRIRDEAHRRAISYHRKRRDKQGRRSELDMIPGIGDKRKKILLKYLGDLQAISIAKVAVLERIPGISQRIAQNIFDYFHKKSP
jgi:excinuclease ABC subunit C